MVVVVGNLSEFKALYDTFPYLYIFIYFIIMKKIIFAGLTVATLWLIGVSVYADTVVNSSQISSRYPWTATNLIQRTNWIITVTSDATVMSVSTPLDIGIDESKLSKMTEAEKQKYIEEKLRVYAIKHSGTMNTQSWTIHGSGTIMLSWTANLVDITDIWKGSIISSWSITTQWIDESKFQKMTEAEKQKYIETILIGKMENINSNQIHTITVSSDGSWITTSGVLEPIKISSKNEKKKFAPKKKRVKKSN